MDHETPLILVAEDNPAMRLLVSALLRDEGYRVHEARDGHDLLEHLGSAMLTGRPYDVVVSDVRMPGPSGLEILRALAPDARRAPFVLMTAFADATLHEQARACGAWEIVDKPFALETLAGVLRDLLARRPPVCAACGVGGRLAPDPRYHELTLCEDCRPDTPPAEHELGVGD